MTAKPTQPRVDFANVDKDSELYDLLELAEETIEKESEWSNGRIAEFVAGESDHLCTTTDNQDLETLAELREHDSLVDGELDPYRQPEYAQDGATETIKAIIKRSIDIFVYNRIKTDSSDN